MILCFLGWYAQEYPDSALHLELLNEPVLLDDYTQILHQDICIMWR
jgi:hypothetical protein